MKTGIIVLTLLFTTEVFAHEATASGADLGELQGILQLFLVLGGAFVAIVAGLGFIFFGLDIRRAKIELEEGRKEVRERREQIDLLAKEIEARVSNLRKTQSEFEELVSKNVTEFEVFAEKAEERIGQLAAQMEDARPTASDELTTIETGGDDEADAEAIRKVIRASKFTWTSLERISSKTGLDRDEVLRLSRRSHDIRIGRGKRSRDHIFRLELDA